MEAARPSQLRELHAAVRKSEAALLQVEPSTTDLVEHSALCRRLCRALWADGRSELAEAYAERADALEEEVEREAHRGVRAQLAQRVPCAEEQLRGLVDGPGRQHEFLGF